MRISAVEGYRLWAPSYDCFPNPLVALERRMLAGTLGPVQGKQIVDVGCGTGRLTLVFQQGGATVIGLDCSSEMLCEAARKTPLRGRLVHASAMALPIASEVSDLTVCSFVIGYVPNAADAIAEMRRITKRGGAVIISDLHPVASAAGWNRSFRRNGSVYEIEHHYRSTREICTMAAEAGLEFSFQTDGYFDEPERSIFRAAGKEAAFAEVAKTPAVWIGAWARPCF
jgi:ubiquinone/menaquinone biosynthesis C-methylase UbiE